MSSCFVDQFCQEADLHTLELTIETDVWCVCGTENILFFSHRTSISMGLTQCMFNPHLNHIDSSSDCMLVELRQSKQPDLKEPERLWSDLIRF